MIVIPGRELLSPRSLEAGFEVRNRGTTPVDGEIQWRLEKYTGARWVRINSPHSGWRGAERLDPGESRSRSYTIEGLFGLNTLGPGIYVHVETIRPVGRSTSGGAVPCR